MSQKVDSKCNFYGTHNILPFAAINFHFSTGNFNHHSMDSKIFTLNIFAKEKYHKNWRKFNSLNIWTFRSNTFYTCALRVQILKKPFLQFHLHVNKKLHSIYTKFCVYNCKMTTQCHLINCSHMQWYTKSILMLPLITYFMLI